MQAAVWITQLVHDVSAQTYQIMTGNVLIYNNSKLIFVPAPETFFHLLVHMIKPSIWLSDYIKHELLISVNFRFI